MRKISIGNVKHFAEAAQKNVKLFRRLDSDFFGEQLKALADKLNTGRYSLSGGFTSYRPRGGRKWSTADGGEITATLVELIIGWFDRGWEDEFECGAEYVQERFLISHCDQESYELGQLRGDHQ